MSCDEVLERQVERDEDRELREQRQARRGRVDVVLLVELHQLFVQLLRGRPCTSAGSPSSPARAPAATASSGSGAPSAARARSARAPSARRSTRPTAADRAVEEVENRLHQVLERRAGSRRASRVVNSAVRPRVAAKQAPGRLRQAAEDAVLANREHRVLRAARVELAGVRRQERRDEQLVEPDREDDDALSCGGLPEHLVDALLEPVVAVRLGRLRQAAAHDEHVVVRRRHALEPGRGRSRAAGA